MLSVYENKGADQLHNNCEADLRLCFRMCKKQFSHDAAHIVRLYSSYLRAITAVFRVSKKL